MKRTVRFTNPQSAKSYAEKVGGELRDIRNNEERKSDFKVVFDTTKRPHNADRREWDFNSPINSGSWHTSEDL